MIFYYCYSLLDHKNIFVAHHQLLSKDDRTRFFAISHPLRKSQFIAGRLLSQFAAQKAGYCVALDELAINSAGQVYFSSYPQLAISITHSHHYVAAACAPINQLGIDSELKATGRFLINIAKRVFIKQKYDQLRMLPTHQRQAFFYQLWVEKEARYKAQFKNNNEGFAQHWQDRYYTHCLVASSPISRVCIKIPLGLLHSKTISF